MASRFSHVYAEFIKVIAEDVLFNVKASLIPPTILSREAFQCLTCKEIDGEEFFKTTHVVNVDAVMFRKILDAFRSGYKYEEEDRRVIHFAKYFGFEKELSLALNGKPFYKGAFCFPVPEMKPCRCTKVESVIEVPGSTPHTRLFSQFNETSQDSSGNLRTPARSASGSTSNPSMFCRTVTPKRVAISASNGYGDSLPTRSKLSSSCLDVASFGPPARNSLRLQSTIIPAVNISTPEVCMEKGEMAQSDSGTSSETHGSPHEMSPVVSDYSTERFCQINDEPLPPAPSGRLIDLGPKQLSGADDDF
eukprot:GHVT01058961.1.p1 GENE.GHVT01058961.1~~GHVT01058961.1.p1  ORF type:complete len:306 (+),score=23.74 GHVT01058961.1:1692-2609(+)